MGVVRPGFPVMTLAFQTEAPGMYWLASPNRAGYHFNAGLNGDLPGDLYRIQAGAALLDRETGDNYYDAYAASIVVHPPDGARDSVSILAPGERSLANHAGREHPIFLALDSHDTEEVGGALGFGGMVFPALPADARWTVTRPDGEVGGCHDANHPLGLDLQAGVAYGNTVGVPANQPPAMDRVLEFAPPLSYLIHKINNSHLAVGGVGQQMPVGLSISPADIVAIVTWIEDGALP